MEKLSFKSVKLPELDYISRVTFWDLKLSYRPLRLLKNSLKNGKIIGCYERKRLVGFIERFRLGKNSYGVSTLYVLPEFRRRGIATKLIHQVCLEVNKSFIYTATSIPGLVKVLKSLDFKEVDRKNVPFSVFVRWFLLRYYHPLSLTKLLYGDYSGIKIYKRYLLS